MLVCSLFFFNDTATTEIYTLSLHDALPISTAQRYSNITKKNRWFSGLGDPGFDLTEACGRCRRFHMLSSSPQLALGSKRARSEEHTSELQSLAYLVCRLLLEKKKDYNRSMS